MFGQDDTIFTIHNIKDKCGGEQSNSQEEEESANIEELLQDFPWSKKALRLYKLMKSQLTDDIDVYFIIDILKFCVTPETKFNNPKIKKF